MSGFHNHNDPYANGYRENSQSEGSWPSHEQGFYQDGHHEGNHQGEDQHIYYDNEYV